MRLGCFVLMVAGVRHVDRMILACFVLGVSTRKVAQVLFANLGGACKCPLG